MQITTVAILATVVCTIASANDLLDQYDVGASGRELSGNIQYTPDLSPWDGIYEKFPLPDHTPAGVTWMTEDAWKPWDGVPLDPTKYETNQKFVKALCPNNNAVLGQKELFYQHNPFSNVTHPSKADVDEWNRLLLNHIRALVGYTGPDYEAKPDICLHAIALWGSERLATTIWDSRYPDNPCLTSTNAHCSDTFRPSFEDQKPYLPDGHEDCSMGGLAGGVTSVNKVDIPWCIQLSRTVCGYIAAEGFWGKHVGPFFLREYYGFSFYDKHPEDPNNYKGMEHRGRYSGKLMSHLHKEPTGGGDDGDDRECSKLFSFRCK